MLNQTAEYALRATLFIARSPAERRVRVNEISVALGVPQNYLSKTLYALAQNGILDSQRGPHGGFLLARDPGTLTLAEVIDPFDPIQDRCLLMRRQCSDVEPCLAHARWKVVAVGIRSFFRETTLEELIQGGGEQAIRTTFSALPTGSARSRAARRPQEEGEDEAEE